jgi:Protein of unknown function (DUF3365)
MKEEAVASRGEACPGDMNVNGGINLFFKLGSYLASSNLVVAMLLVMLASCQTSSTPHVTETDGSYLRLPDNSTKALVWGTEPEAVKSLKTWLLKQRIPLIDDVKLNQLASEMGLNKSISSADVLKLAKTIGAKQVIFVDADVYKSQRDDIASFFGQATIYKASLFIRAVNAETGEIDWSGKAQSRESFTDLSEGIHQLTCHALATAWGLRQPGTATAPSVCLPGQNAMVLAEPHTARYILAIAKAFRTVYSKQIVAQAARSNVKPDEEWTKNEHGIMLPAQFLKAAGRELEDFELSLIGLTPIYKENLPKTKAEEDALRQLVANPATNMVTFEDGNQFKGLAVDLAIADSCVACHNTHPTSPKRDFKKGDVMGAIVVRFNK